MRSISADILKRCITVTLLLVWLVSIYFILFGAWQKMSRIQYMLTPASVVERSRNNPIVSSDSITENRLSIDDNRARLQKELCITRAEMTLLSVYCFATILTIVIIFMKKRPITICVSFLLVVNLLLFLILSRY